MIVEAMKQALGALDALIADPGEDRIRSRIWDQARASADALRSAITKAEEVEQQAKRYAWLRDEAVLFGFDDGRPSAWAVSGTGYDDCAPIRSADLDAAIDSAIAAQEAGKGSAVGGER